MVQADLFCNICVAFSKHLTVHIWAAMRGFQQSEIQTSLLSYKDYVDIESSLVASWDMILSNKLIAKELIRLCECAGWSTPLLFQIPMTCFFTPKPIWISVTAVGGKVYQLRTQKILSEAVQLWQFFSFLLVDERWEDPNTCTTISGPSSASQGNTIKMVFRWRATDGPTLNAGSVAS